MNLDTALRRLVLLVGLAAAIPLRSGDLESHPFRVESYQAALSRVWRQQAADDRVVVPLGRTRLLTHGARAARVVVLLHGFTDSPDQFAALADSLYERGDNVYVPRLPHHAERAGDARALAGLTAVELRRTADSAVDVAAALADTVIVMGLSVGGTMAGWIGQHRPEVQRAVLVAPAFEAGRVPSRLEGYLINLTERLPNVTRREAPDSLRPDRNPGFATHALAEVLRLGGAVRDVALREPPRAPEFTLLLNDHDRTVKSAAAVRLAREWEAHGAMVSLYTIPDSLGLPHNVVDPREAGARPEMILPALVALAHGDAPGGPLRGCRWPRAVPVHHGPADPCASVTRIEARSCTATPSTMTPAGWAAPSRPDGKPSVVRTPLALVTDVPLPGPAKRFDYQSFDSTTGRLYISHMRGDRLVVFDTRARKLVASEPGFPGATGVWAVPQLHRVYVSVTGRHEVAVIDDRTLAVVARVGGVRFPDGIAFAPEEQKVFVSDESGGVDVVIDARSNAVTSRIALGGEAGNTHYDAVSHCIVVAVQTKNELVAIDPQTERVVGRYAMPCAHPHGFLIDEPNRLAFITCEGDARLLVLDLRTMRTTATLRTADDPDVLALDPGLHRLYVGCESGAISVFAERFDGDRGTLVPIGEYRTPHAHSVSVDPTTHRVYVPLEEVSGKPTLRILEPGA